MADDSNKSVLQNGVVALNGIWNALLQILDVWQNAFPASFGTYTVAALPTGVVQGTRVLVTDSNSTTFNATVAGGGANIVPVFWNGTNWKIG